MGQKKILVVDDEEGFLKLFKLNLEKEGRYSVKTVKNSAQAPEAAKEFQPDIIFLDIIMPGVAGGEVAQILKQNPSTKDIPIVFLTAVARPTEVDSSGGYIGGRPFLAKPADTKDIIATVEKYSR